jgi:hypothetical protein
MPERRQCTPQERLSVQRRLFTSIFAMRTHGLVAVERHLEGKRCLSYRNVCSSFNRRETASAFYQLKLGHGYNKAYLFRIGKADSLCFSCGALQTPACVTYWSLSLNCVVDVGSPRVPDATSLASLPG